MKIIRSFWRIITALCFVCLLDACTIATETMLDASVPNSEQSLIVVVSEDGQWKGVNLIYVDDLQYDVSSSMFYVPSGFHNLGFDISSSTTELTDVDYRDKVEVQTYTTTTGNAELSLSAEFLPEHTYRITIVSAFDLRIEDITDNIDWLAPLKSPFSPHNGVLTNWKFPRGLWLMPTVDLGFFAQYTKLPGKDSNILGWSNNDQVIIMERGKTGIKPFTVGGALRGGIDVGISKLGLSMQAEINGGLGFGDTTYEASLFNNGYLFISELYYYRLVGIGFGYGETTTVYEFFGSGINPATQATYENSFPYLRFELLLFPKIPLILYGDYYYHDDAWSVGVQLSFLGKGMMIFPKLLLE